MLRQVKKIEQLYHFIQFYALLILLSLNSIFAQSSDTDGDGIPDSSDSCPTQAETIKGFEDSDGCPDIIPTADSTPISESEDDNSLLQWTAVIASVITAVGAIGATKLRKSS